MSKQKTHMLMKRWDPPHPRRVTTLRGADVSEAVCFSAWGEGGGYRHSVLSKGGNHANIDLIERSWCGSSEGYADPHAEVF